MSLKHVQLNLTHHIINYEFCFNIDKLIVVYFFEITLKYCIWLQKEQKNEGENLILNSHNKIKTTWYILNKKSQRNEKEVKYKI